MALVMQICESLLVEEWPLDRLKPYPGNPRVITSAAVSKVAMSLSAFGWRQPIVVDTSDVIIVGHTRRLAAMKLGLTTAPVHVAVGMKPEEVAAYRLADNRSGEEARWDLSALAVSMDDLAASGVDLAMTAFDPAEWTGTATPDFKPVGEAEVKRLDRRADVTCPGCGLAFVP